MQFRGEYFPFSNMYPLDEWIEADCGIAVPTSEHAYMANRLHDPSLQVAVASVRGADRTAGGLAAKRLAYTYIEEGAEQTIRTEAEKIHLMRRIVLSKLLANGAIQELLIGTGEIAVEEGNGWGDVFWGISPVGSGVGANHLGRIYMELRAQLKG